MSEHLTEAALRRSPDPVSAALDALCEGVRQDSSGEVATYIPELGCADPEHLGISLVSLVGRRYEAATPGCASRCNRSPSLSCTRSRSQSAGWRTC